MQPQQIRALVEDNRPTEQNAGYPEHVRRAVAHYAHECRAQGHRWADIATATGVSAASAATWCKQFSRFLPVTVTQDVPQQTLPALSSQTSHHGLVLRTPSGYALAGLDLQDAITLLRELR